MTKNASIFKALSKAMCYSLSVFIIVSALWIPVAAYAADGTGEEPVYLPIFMYHEVKFHRFGKDAISSWEFESDLKFLAKNHYTAINMTDLINYFYGTKSIPDKPVMLTFDDGYLNNYKWVLPLIKKYNVKIVLSIIVNSTEDFTKFPSDNIDYSHVTWGQLNEMLASGLVEVQNHSFGLHTITKKRMGCLKSKFESLPRYEKVMLDDTILVQNRIFQMTGFLPNTYAYPYGFYSDSTDVILKRLGFLATLSCEYGINEISRTNTPDLYHLKRICRSHNEPLKTLLMGAYKAMKVNFILP